MRFKPFPKQRPGITSQAKILGLFAGKRGGKTEVGAVRAVIHSEQQIGHKPNGRDPYVGLIIAPTSDMLRRLSMKKFLAFAKPFKPFYHQTFQEAHWHNGTIIYGVSADNPARMEGIKANFAWIDEVFQTNEQTFLEAQARVADTNGRVWCTGSLGVQFQNPKAHWAYKYFKHRPLEGYEHYEWGTEDNPHFPRDELARLKSTLDPRTYRQMFQLSWDVPGTALVYDEFDEANVVRGYVYNPELPTYCVIDWGWNHPMACLYFQVRRNPHTQLEEVVLFDEIVGSKLKLEHLWDRMRSKGYRVTEYICDIAGNQEREQTGISNVQWFKNNASIDFSYRATAINYGIPIVRTFIRNGLGQRRFFVDEMSCPKSLDGLRTYSYPEKNGLITGEDPVKKDDDCVDAIRYLFVNKLDYNIPTDTMVNIGRFGDSFLKL